MTQEMKAKDMPILYDAYCICLLVKEFTGNVLAGNNSTSKTDKHYYNQANRYIKWFEKKHNINANQIAKRKEL